MWNLEHLRGDVERLHGAEQLEALRPCLRSANERFQFCQFHYQSAMGLMEEQVRGLDNMTVLANLIFGADPEAHGSFSRARIQATAHLVACLQSLQAVSDTFAHVLYFGLALNLNPSTELASRDITLAAVKKKVGKVPAAGLIVGQIDSLMKADSYVYLHDLVNHSKHRSLIETPYSYSPLDDVGPSHGLKLAEFTYQDRQQDRRHVDRWVKDFLPDEFHRHSRFLVDCGRELSWIVRMQLELYSQFYSE